MTNIGEIRSGSDIGYLDRGRRIWDACPVCHKERWIPLRYKSNNPVCVTCAQKRLNPITYTGGQPKLGDTAKASVLGHVGHGLWIWVACSQCGKERWREKRFQNKLCPQCGIPKGGMLRRRSNNGKWTGGVRHTSDYVYITVDESHPFFAMARKTGKNVNHYQIAEHRLVMAQQLGRPLTSDEIVHHINGVKSDNRNENLQLLEYNQHHSLIVLSDLQKNYRVLESRMLLLEAENTSLRYQLDSMLIPSQTEKQLFSGVCRDLTGDIPNGMKGKSMLTGNCEVPCCSRRQPQLIGVSVEQSTDKLLANSGKTKTYEGHVNPELSGDSNVS